MAHWRHSWLIGCSVVLGASLGSAGDLYWSSLDFVNPYDVDVCGTTVYVASQGGLYRTWGDPEQWQQVWPGEVSRVACDGGTVLFVPGREWEGPLMVSHDNLQTAHAATGLDAFMYLGIEDLDVAGTNAVVAFDHGVLRSTDGGDSFSIYAVLWESSGDYDLKAVWTDGSACATAGSGGYTYGIWYSATCERDTFSVVAAVGGQNWLSASGDTLISGSYYTDEIQTFGHVSTDGGASWSPVPWYPGQVNPDFNRPFLSGSLILSSTSYEVYEPAVDDFVGHLDGLYLTDLDTLEGTDMQDGYPDSDEIWFHAIVDTPDPWLLIAESLDAWAPISPAQLRWLRSPGGWPSPLDLAPPTAGSLTAAPSLATLAQAPSASLTLSADGASRTRLVAGRYTLSSDWIDNTIWVDTELQLLDVGGDWEPYGSFRSVPFDGVPGQYVFHAWFADDRGFMSDPSVWDATTVLPATLTLGEHQCVGYWLYAEQGESFTFGAASPGGGGDLDILWWWVPGYGWAGFSTAAGANDVLNVTAPADGFYDLFLCNYPGNGTFSGALVASGGRSEIPLDLGTLPQNTPPSGTDVELSDGATSFGDWLQVYSSVFADDFESGGTSQWSAAVP